MDPALEVTEDRNSYPRNQAQRLVVVSRELPVCDVVADGIGTSPSAPSSLSPRTNSSDDGALGVRQTYFALELALAGEATLRDTGWRSIAFVQRWILAFVIPSEPERRRLNAYGQ